MVIPFESVIRKGEKSKCIRLLSEGCGGFQGHLYFVSDLLQGCGVGAKEEQDAS